MRITLESDYALRIVGALASSDDKIDAHAISERTSVTQKFTLKIYWVDQKVHSDFPIQANFWLTQYF